MDKNKKKIIEVCNLTKEYKKNMEESVQSIC